LQAAVKRDGADLGIMFDGDADRVMFVDEMGTITPVDLMFVLLAREALSQRKGRVFYDLRFSRSVKDEITALGGEPVTLRVGNPFYKEALHQHADGLLAAELSGHIMYKDRFGIDDAFYAALKLISYLTTSKQPLSQQIAEIRRYTGSGELRIETDDPQALVDKAKATHAAAAISELDGVTVEYSDWWFNLRPSNTEPIAKLVIEADSPGSLERRKAELLGQLS
jgi:phosphomannomutase